MGFTRAACDATYTRRSRRRRPRAGRGSYASDARDEGQARVEPGGVLQELGVERDGSSRAFGRRPHRLLRRESADVVRALRGAVRRLARRPLAETARAVPRRGDGGAHRGRAQFRVAAHRRYLAVHRRVLRRSARAASGRRRLLRQDGRLRVRLVVRARAGQHARPDLYGRLRRARFEVPGLRRRADRGPGRGSRQRRYRYPALVRGVAQNRQQASRAHATPARHRAESCARRDEPALTRDRSMSVEVRGAADHAIVPGRSRDFAVLADFQTLLADIYQLDVAYDVDDFVITDPEVVGLLDENGRAVDEKLLIAEREGQ